MDTSGLDSLDSILNGDFSGIDPASAMPVSYLDGTSSSLPSATASSSFMNTAMGASSLIQGAGSIMSGIGGYMQGMEEAGADEYNASLALMEGEFQKEEISAQEGETLSTQKAMYAKAGVELSGSPVETALSTATEYEYSKEVANYNAQSKANMYQYEANMAKSKGEFALGSGLLQGGMALGMGALMLL